MNTNGKVAVACLLGSLIGAILALQFHAFWWIGVIVGGAVGSVSCAPKEFLTIMKKVWAEMPEHHIIRGWIKKGAEELCNFTIPIVLFLGAVVLVITTFASGVLSVLQAFFFFGRACEATELMTSYWFWIGGTLVMYLFVFVDYRTENKKTRGAQWVAIACTPALSFITLPLAALYGAYWVLKTAGKLFWRTTKIVHSDIRILCMTDSMVGALVGYFTGNALIGGLVGCALGVVDYKLVSVRFLKLAPQA